MYSIEQFQELNKPERIVLTQHSRKRFAERGISLDDIVFTLRTGGIIGKQNEVHEVWKARL